jgi:hypothetical protein
MTGYTKLFSSIVTSTIWQEDAETKVVWVTMLALADADGVVDATLPGLAHLARIPLKKTIEAVKKFQAPDQHSRTQDHDGRRVMQIDGGWQLLNHAKYRAVQDKNERREYLRIKQQEFRDRKKREKEEKACQSRKQSVNKNKQNKQKYTQAEAEAEAEEEEEKQLCSNEKRFERFWSVYPRKVGKGTARKVWNKLKPDEEFTREIIAKIEQLKRCEAWTKDNGKYIPHPTKWLRRDGWEDEVESEAAAETPEQKVARLKREGHL